jgi:hypothetical protein
MASVARRSMTACAADSFLFCTHFLIARIALRVQREKT